MKTFEPDRTAYIQSQVKVAAIAMTGAIAVLWLLGEAQLWLGGVAGLGAIALRGLLMARSELGQIWTLEDDTLHGPKGLTLPVDQIKDTRVMGSFVRIETNSGAVHLIKYLSDPVASEQHLKTARANAPKPE